MKKQILKAYSDFAFTRYDDCDTVFYFSAADFPGLKSEPYRFASSLGHELKGYFYYYDGCREDRLIVFDHGMGGGHAAYMKEIELLAKKGYLVFS